MAAWQQRLEEELELRESLRAEQDRFPGAASPSASPVAGIAPPVTSVSLESSGSQTPTNKDRPFPVRRPDDEIRAELAGKTIGDLLALSRAILAELRHRGVIRSGNAPAGDYAELLVGRATNGELARTSKKGWDVLTGHDERLQVKARVITDPKAPGERQLSVFRSWDFDAAVIVLFDDEFRVWRATRVGVSEVKNGSRFVQHVSGYRILATDKFLDRGEDWTELLRAAEG